MRLSVIVPTHDRAASLERVLAAVAAQTLATTDFEVVVVDDGSTPASRARTRVLAPPCAYRLVEQDQAGLAAARNRGVEEARGEVVLFLDDDVIPAPATFAEHLASHDASAAPVAVVGSLPYPPWVEVDTFLWYLEHSGHFDLYRHPRKYAGGRPPMPPMNGNSSVERRHFAAVGGYDASFRAYGSEDLDLGYRLERAGVAFVYNPRAVGYHDHVKGFARFCVDMEAAGEGLVALYRRYPEIRAAKKIDVLEDPFHRLTTRKQLVKLVMSTTFALPWLLAPLRLALVRARRAMPLRHLLLPLYRLVAHHHYAVGMRRGLARGA